MRVSYLELRNYRRFRDLKLQFSDGVIGILGMNGAGKTTIIESIAWALFGNVEEVVRTSRESVRRVGADSHEVCSVALEFELGGAEYRIEREMGGRNLSMRAELRTKDKLLAEGDKPVRRMVEKLLGMDHKSFFTSVFARQKELNALQNVSPGERKKVVLRMLRIDGIDAALADIRSDKRDTLSRIEGSQRTLLMDDGRERESVLQERLPTLSAALDSVSKDFRVAELKEHQAGRELEVARKRRDELKKDVDAYNSSASDLKAVQSSLIELRKREQNTIERISAAESRLKRLPSLEKDEARFKMVTERKDILEKERAKHDKAGTIREEIRRDKEEIAQRTAEMARLEEGLGKIADVESDMSEVDRSKSECEAVKEKISGLAGELRAKMAERQGKCHSMCKGYQLY